MRSRLLTKLALAARYLDSLRVEVADQIILILVGEVANLGHELDGGFAIEREMLFDRHWQRHRHDVSPFWVSEEVPLKVPLFSMDQVYCTVQYAVKRVLVSLQLLYMCPLKWTDREGGDVSRETLFPFPILAYTGGRL